MYNRSARLSGNMFLRHGVCCALTHIKSQFHGDKRNACCEPETQKEWGQHSRIAEGCCFERLEPFVDSPACSELGER